MPFEFDHLITYRQISVVHVRKKQLGDTDISDRDSTYGMLKHQLLLGSPSLYDLLCGCGKLLVIEFLVKKHFYFFCQTDFGVTAN